MKNIKDKATNVCAFIGAISGAILTIETQGVVIPKWLKSYAIISAALAAAITMFLIGKNSDGSIKTPEQLK